MLRQFLLQLWKEQNNVLWRLGVPFLQSTVLAQVLRYKV